jgi:hypothetical protein
VEPSQLCILRRAHHLRKQIRSKERKIKNRHRSVEQQPPDGQRARDPTSGARRADQTDGMRIRARIWVRNQPLSLCSSVLLFSFLPLVFVARRDATGTRTKLPAMLRRSGDPAVRLARGAWIGLRAHVS